MRILLIDNYDSFTYNLAQIIQHENFGLTVLRNDEVSVEDAQKYDRIIFSPGPGVPSEAGNMSEIIKSCAGKVPMLGICLGHQAIGEYLGGILTNLTEVYHGVQSEIETEKDSILFEGLDSKFKAGRYHSWILEGEGDFEVTARVKDGSIMAIENRKLNAYGVQFHPESILSPEGKTIIHNFINLSI